VTGRHGNSQSCATSSATCPIATNCWQF
jgi:hypothetical protein